MTKLFSRFLLFTPLAILFLWDSIVPIDTFNLRAWETLCVMRPSAVLKGSFYPGIDLTKFEAANVMIRFGGKDVRKTNHWVTDRYGYRKQEPYPRPIEIAVIGDSNVAGSGISQNELFTEVYENISGAGAYPIAVGGIESLFIHPYFRMHKPKVVVVSFIERNLTKFAPYHTPLSDQGFRKFMRDLDFKTTNLLLSMPWALKAGVFIDRAFYKKTLAQFLKTHYLMPALDVEIRIKNRPEPEIIFYQGDAANEPVPEELIESTARTFASYRDAVTKLGARFVFMPIPNKETIYYDQLPKKQKSVFLEQLTARLRERGVEVVDLTAPYFEYREKNPGSLLYDPEDVHWNAAGIRVAAAALQKHLEKDRIPS